MAETRSLRIKQSERVFVAGKTGSGKTWGSMALLLPVKRMLVFDPKDDLGEWKIDRAEGDALKKFMEGGPGRIRLFDRQKFIELLERCLREKVSHFTCYIDEIYSLIPPRTPTPEVINTLYTRGRSLNIGMWTVTQRPTWLPLVAMSESEWYLIFRLNLEQDRKRVAEVAGVKELETPVDDPHGFRLYNIEWKQPIYYKQVAIKSPMATVETTANMPNSSRDNGLLIRSK